MLRLPSMIEIYASQEYKAPEKEVVLPPLDETGYIKAINYIQNSKKKYCFETYPG